MAKISGLVRLSNDGQTIVHNNTAIYQNTKYPKAMVDAGTAPAHGDGDGSVGNPADGEEDGDDAGLQECLSTEECELTEEQVRSYLSSIGVDGDKDQSADGVAERIVGNAISKGKCDHPENNSAYCGLVASFGLLAQREVSQSGDFIYWAGEISYGGGAKKYHEAKIPAIILDTIELLMKISLALSALSITLRGKAW